MLLVPLIRINTHKVFHINKPILNPVNVYESEKAWCKLVRTCICAQKMIFQKKYDTLTLPPKHRHMHTPILKYLQSKESQLQRRIQLCENS